MKMLLVCAAGLFLLLSLPIHLSSQSFSWVELGGGSVANDYAFDMTTDMQGNIYVVGLSGGVGSFGSLEIDRGGFIVKYDPTGNFLWGKFVENAEFHGVAVDNEDGSVHVVGDSALFPFLTRYDLNGNYLSSFYPDQARVAGNQIYDVAVDGGGSTYITGALNYRAWVAKIGPDGREIWSRFFSWENSNPDVAGWKAFAVTLDDVGNVYVAANNSDIRIIKLTPSGDVVRETVAHCSWTLPGRMVYDGSGHLMLSVGFSDTLQFGDIILTSNQNLGGGLIKIDTAGNVISGITLTGAGQVYLKDAAVDQEGNIVAVGFANDGFQVGSEHFAVQGKQAIVAKFDPEMNLLGLVSPGVASDCYSVALRDGDVFVAGTLPDDANQFGGFPLDPGRDIYGDVFVAKLGSLTSVQDEGTSPITLSGSISPNPVVNRTTFSAPIAVEHITIYDITGRAVQSYDVSLSPQETASLDFAELPSGLYYVRARGKNGVSVVTALKH